LERRLAAILAADVAGYTALMGADEAGTLRRLTELRREFLEPLIGAHHGRVVKLMGDGFLVEFASVVDAVACALAWQKGVADRDTGLRFRIGINLGDVIVQGGDIHGDGVNIAARLEGLAEPGGICLSGDAYRQARGKIEAAFEDMGEQSLKNVAEPVRVYRIGGDGSGAADAAPVKKPLALPDKPSIAVLPFANMSRESEQDYFSDGVTEDIITELSRFRELFVIARNSSFSYKGKAAKVQDIATDLGVRYVLEGSVRAAGNRIRVIAQLIDAETGHHIWSERYDREMPDLFALQDEIAQTVAGTVAGRLRLTAEDRAERKPIESLEAYDYALRAQSIIADSKGENLRARETYQKAIERDPACTKAYIGLARSYIIDSINHWWEPGDRPLDHALACAAKAVSLDNTDSRAQLILGGTYVQREEYEEAKVHLERALELNPNDADAFALMGFYREGIGEPEAAIECYLTAMRLNPYYPAWYLWALGDAFYGTRQYEKALIPLKDALSRSPKLKRPRLTLAAAYAQLDRLEKARREVEKLLAGYPDASIEQERQSKFSSDAARDHWIGALRKAGLPE
jgi:TolB-like protein/Tfp pilus assembly protein PilF